MTCPKLTLTFFQRQETITDSLINLKTYIKISNSRIDHIFHSSNRDGSCVQKFGLYFFTSTMSWWMLMSCEVAGSWERGATLSTRLNLW